MKDVIGHLPRTTPHPAPRSGYADETGASFSALDIDRHPMGIHVGHFEKSRLLKPKTARKQGRREDEVVKGFHIAKDMIDFFPAEDTWQALFRLGFQAIPVNE